MTKAPAKAVKKGKPPVEKKPLAAAIVSDDVPIDALVPYAMNSRTHSAAQIKAIANSIKEFGFTKPILVWKGNEIIAGHGAVMAAKELLATGKPEFAYLKILPVRRCEHLTDAERKMYVITDNQTATMSAWDKEIMAVELTAMDKAGLDLSLTGFDAVQLAALMNPGGDEEEGEGDEEEEKEPFKNTSFRLHETQAAIVDRALDLSAGLGKFDQSLNDNARANALTRICEMFINQQEE